MLSYRKLYYGLIDKNSPILVKVRQEMVEYAIKNGIKNTTKQYGVNRKTISKWKKRYLQKEPLKDKSKVPKNCPHQINKAIEIKIIDYVKKLIRNNKKEITKELKVYQR